ncbi:MAG: UDP-N-acetylglucosamine 1-carboxyvinyltransferase [Candidatus Moraniibacteriota bacterium]|nr:MAG: UDP-N-acetylglucosamine 1-carboxyvinyltransferase [Candidatus Moranbacteria bacterium]
MMWTVFKGYFMEVFEIQGGKKLSGTIAVAGLKNAATPILAATLLTKETCVLKNVPRIEDVFRMIEILESLGATIEWQGDHEVAITARDIDVTRVDQEIIKRLRSSIMLLGALSARVDHFEIRQPGGCVIGARPVGTHIDALEKLGVHIVGDGKSYVVDATQKKSGKVVLQGLSVTATENAMLLAATLPGTTVIKVAACEPHVEDLGKFLQALGVEITGLGTHTLTIVGKAILGGATYTIMPDHNEAATFLVLGAVTGSELTVENAREDDLNIVLEKLKEFGVTFTLSDNAITIHPTEHLKAIKPWIDTRTYPGMPSDNQSVFGVLATQAEGDTLIFETLYEGRFSYIPELIKMGARAEILNPHQVVIHGKTPLQGTTIKSFDLRAGVALIIAALAAEGTTIIEEIYQVDRGYERIEERLQKIGANIVRKEVS